jgi:hypothetical protein
MLACPEVCPGVDYVPGGRIRAKSSAESRVGVTRGTLRTSPQHAGDLVGWVIRRPMTQAFAKQKA